MNTYIWCDDTIEEFEYKFAAAVANTLEEALVILTDQIEKDRVKRLNEITNIFKKWSEQHPEYEMQYMEKDLPKEILGLNEYKTKLINKIKTTIPLVLTIGEAKVIDHSNE